MKYTLSQAAEATGKNKATIQRAIKSGKISAKKNDSGAYEIDPSELHRVFEVTVQHIKKEKQATVRNTKTPPDYNTLQRITELEKELAVAQERKSGLEGQLNHLTETVDDLRNRLDRSEGRVTALLEGPRSNRTFFWSRKGK